MPKMNGLSAVIDMVANSFGTISEIIAFPFGFLIYFNPPEDGCN